MGRSILAVIAGVVCAVLTVGMIESIGHFVYPPPPGVDISDPDQLRTIMERLPTGALLFVMAAWIVGALVGGLVAAKLARSHAMRAALAVGTMMIVLVAINLVGDQHTVDRDVRHAAELLERAGLVAEALASGAHDVGHGVGGIDLEARRAELLAHVVGDLDLDRHRRS